MLPLFAVGVVALVLLGAGGWVLLHRGSAAPARPAAKHAAPSHAVAAAPTAKPAPSASRPTDPRLIIAKIRVNAHIESVGVDSHGSMGVPSSPWNVGWYKLGTKPGDPGDAVMDGHLDWWTTGPAVFWNLGSLRVGDPVKVVRQDGRTVNFVVDSVKVYPYTAHPAGLFVSGGPARLSLITCTGSWDATHANYLQRLIVNAHLA